MKYIVDIDDFEPLFKVDSIGVFGIGKSVSDSDNDHSWSRIKSIEEFEELNSDYINEHYGQLQQDAYDKGYKDGRNVTETQAHDDAYQRGLEDAWEAARKIADMWETMDNEDLLETFGVTAKIGESVIGTLFKKQTANEAMLELEAYEEKQKADSEIKVGDEVYAYTPSGKTRPFIIIKIYDEDGVKYYSGINADGNHVQGGLNYIKTGRHFPHVAELLKAMKE